jgi:hypothetical protein
MHASAEFSLARTSRCYICILVTVILQYQAVSFRHPINIPRHKLLPLLMLRFLPDRDFERRNVFRAMCNKFLERKEREMGDKAGGELSPFRSTCNKVEDE